MLRLPGIRFEVQPPPPRDPLPRMDVAAFVGFAASGPMHRPVLVEDMAGFEAIFGRDLPLAWDAQRGEQVYAYLAPAVRAFLRNGGQRCYVIRVADRGTATSNLFPLPSIAQVNLRENGTISGLAPAFAQARSQGSWSDALRAGAGLLARSVMVTEIEQQANTLTLMLAGLVGVGDLLRLTFPDGLIVFVAVRSTQRSEIAAPPGPRLLQATGPAVYFRTPQPSNPPEAADTAFLYRLNTPPSSPSEMPSRHPISIVGGLQGTDTSGVFNIMLSMSRADAPLPGTLIEIDAAGGPVWMTVENTRETEDKLSPSQSAVVLEGCALRFLPAGEALPAALPVVEVMQLELRAREGDDDPMRLTRLDFAPGGPRGWASLPDDETLFAEETERPFNDLWREAINPRFPLAGLGGANTFSIPLSLCFADLPPLKRAETRLARDGVANFHHMLFLDSALSDALVRDLINKADFIRYQSPEPRPHLDGIYGVLAIDEITLIAIPDAVHPGWDAVNDETITEAAADLPSERQWDCKTKSVEPPWENFLDCRVEVLPPPTWADEPTMADSVGTFTLKWKSPLISPPRYDPNRIKVFFEVQESLEDDFSDAHVIYRGEDRQFTLYGRSPGLYVYHVRVETSINISNWSEGRVVQVGVSGGYRLRPPDTNALNNHLLNAQRALLRLCAARGDLLAVLALPETDREDRMLAHAAALRPDDRPMSDSDPDRLSYKAQANEIRPLGYGEQDALSYGALYHPWLIGREDTQTALRHTPPDGAICGLIARRTLARGAWIAPANERLAGVVALNPPIAPSRWHDLYKAQINLIRLEPYGFVTLSAETLATDPDLIQISTRRLLILLRRLALREGAEYIFEPNDAVFRRMVQRIFDAVLDGLFMRGAFAGRKPETSYQVIVHDSPIDADAGRLIVDLKVAPAMPLVFLTVRLAQNGERGFSVTESH